MLGIFCFEVFPILRCPKFVILMCFPIGMFLNLGMFPILVVFFSFLGVVGFLESGWFLEV